VFAALNTRAAQTLVAPCAKVFRFGSQSGQESSCSGRPPYDAHWRSPKTCGRALQQKLRSLGRKACLASLCPPPSRCGGRR
jgi:hypothetical protein